LEQYSKIFSSGSLFAVRTAGQVGAPLLVVADDFVFVQLVKLGHTQCLLQVFESFLCFLRLLVQQIIQYIFVSLY